MTLQELSEEYEVDDIASYIVDSYYNGQSTQVQTLLEECRECNDWNRGTFFEYLEILMPQDDAYVFVKKYEV